MSKEDILKRVVSLEFNRFLDYYKNAPVIEQPSANDKNREPKERRERGTDKEKTARKAEKGYTRFFLNLGKTDGFYANQVIELINRNLKKERIQIGRIDLMQNFSFFEVAEAQAPLILKALNKVSLNGRRVVVEIAGENTGKSDKGGRKRGNDESRSSRGGRDGGKGRDSRDEKRGRDAKGRDSKKVEKAEKKSKPSREERGYTAARGPKKKDDWKQFFNHDERPLKGEEPNFSEEGWARRKKK